jgi:hypothetical protein
MKEEGRQVKQQARTILAADLANGSCGGKGFQELA